MLETIVDRITAHAREFADKEAFIFAQTRVGGLATEQLTFGELDRHARAFAEDLRGRCRPGDRALLLYPAGLDFVRALIGCLYAGVVAVPSPVPDNNGKRDTRTAGIVEDAGVSLVLTDTRQAPEIRRFLAGANLAGLPVLATDGYVPTGGEARWTPPAATAGTPAILQYTSGSTSSPKGVVVTHGTLMDNVEHIRRTFGIDTDTRCCSWLPHYHDMGLIGTVLAPLLLGFTVVTMSPTEFLRRPRLWLELIQDYRLDLTAAPNFAYDLVTRTVTDEQLAALDLSSLRTALNGAEPVNAATLERFTARFAAAGVRPTVPAPCYGMAEATLLITGAPPGRGPRTARFDTAALGTNLLRPADPHRVGDDTSLLAGSGPLNESVEVLVVDPDTREVLPAGRIGELWVRGAGVTAGYWGKPEISARMFGAVTTDGRSGFLRTGDLGGVHEGELFVTGRLKDMLVIRGRNLYPHDIERMVADLHPTFLGLQSAVCSVPGEREEIVVLQEMRPPRGEKIDLPALSRRIRGELGDRLGVRVASLVLLRPGQVRLTTSGKVRRSAMRELFVAGELKALHEDLDQDLVRRYREGAPA